MADQVQQQGVGGGEQLPVPAVEAPPADSQDIAAPPQDQPHQIDSLKPEGPLEEQKIKTEGSLEEQKIKTEVSLEEQKIKTEEFAIEQKIEVTTETTQVTEENTDAPSATVPVAEPEVPSQEIQEAAKSQEEQSKVPEQICEPEIKAEPIAAVSIPDACDKINDEGPKESGDWQVRESELLKKIEELEKIKNARSEDGLRLELKVREEEIDLLKARMKNLETELQAALSKPGGKNHEVIESIKQQHEELLSKARGMIFDKTKMVKNQELQIEALTTQVQSLKDINVITKDLLDIRNSEVKAMEDRFQAMEARYRAEKERYDLVLKRAQTSTTINDDLRREYETQLAIFKELREKYELRVQALVAENNRLKEAAKGAGGSG